MRNNQFKNILILIAALLSSSLILFAQKSTVEARECWEECQCTNWCVTYVFGYKFTECCGESCETHCSCDPGACTGCTPACPAGQSTTVSGPLCQQAVASCTGTNGCDPCTLTLGRCYLPETNTAPSQPTSIDINVGENDFSLSLDSGNPTKIKQPMENETVQLETLPFTQPLTARGIGYYFRAFEDTTEIFSSPTPTARTTEPVDPNSSNIQTFTDADELLYGGFSGKAAAMYYTFDKCDYTVKYSTPLEGFFTVDNIPNPPGPNPNICDPEVETCDKFDYLPELGTLQTTRGCESEDYVGQEINNPLRFNLSLTDEDGNDEVEGIVLWFRSKTTTPALPTTMDIVSTNSGIDNDNFGILIKKDTDWTSPTIYQSNTDGTWIEISDNELKDSLGETAMTLLDLTVDTVTNPSIDFDFKLQFNFGSGYTATPITDEYEIYAQGLDTFQIYDDTTEVDRLSYLFDFGVDLTNPTVENVQTTVTDITNAELSWNSDDNKSGIMTTIINGFVSGGTSDIRLSHTVLAGPEIELIIVPHDYTTTEIGYINSPHTLSKYPGYNNIVKVDIQNNESGSIDTYITSYDYACNYSGESEQITLEPWIATKGGTFYSRSGVQTDAKDISETEINTFFNFTKDNVAQGTELLSSRSNYYYQLINPTLGTVAASQIYDSNDKKTYWFNHLKEKFEIQKNSSTVSLRALEDITDLCNDDEYCYYQTTDSISIGSQCSGYTLIISDGNITINPGTDENIPSTRNTGCIYLAKGNINILDGEYRSESSTDVQYDYMEGFFIAEQQIDIIAADSNMEIRDGLEVKGGIVALGNGVSDEALSINRNLRLYNLLYPTLLVNYDFKYGRIAEQYFGTEADIYKQDVGFKNI